MEQHIQGPEEAVESLRLVNEDELARDLCIQFACMSHLLPLRGKHGTPEMRWIVLGKG